jgi:hypothetical protein
MEIFQYGELLCNEIRTLLILNVVAAPSQFMPALSPEQVIDNTCTYTCKTVSRVLRRNRAGEVRQNSLASSVGGRTDFGNFLSVCRQNGNCQGGNIGQLFFDLQMAK